MCCQRSRGTRTSPSRLWTLMRWHKLDVQALGSSCFLSFLVFLEDVACDGLKSVAVLPEGVACDGLKSVAVAVGRVEREPRPVDFHVDRADISRHTVDDLRERIRDDRHLRRMRVDIDSCPNNDSTEVELTQL